MGLIIAVASGHLLRETGKMYSIIGAAVLIESQNSDIRKNGLIPVDVISKKAKKYRGVQRRPKSSPCPPRHHSPSSFGLLSLSRFDSSRKLLAT